MEICPKWGELPTPVRNVFSKLACIVLRFWSEMQNGLSHIDRRIDPVDVRWWILWFSGQELQNGLSHIDRRIDSVDISRRQLTPVFDEPAFSRFSQIRLVVHIFGKIVKRQVCQKRRWVADGWSICDNAAFLWSPNEDFGRFFDIPKSSFGEHSFVIFWPRATKRISQILISWWCVCRNHKLMISW